VRPSGKSHVKAGHTAIYAIFVWSTRATSKNATVSVTASRLADVGLAKFSVCATSSGAVCDVGNLPVGQTAELQATVRLGPLTTPGEHVRLTAKARAGGAGSAKASAAILVTAEPTPTPTPVPTYTANPLPPGTLPPTPQGGTTPSDPSSLFPTVSPGATTSPGATGPGHSPHHGKRVKAVTDAATLPLNPRLIGDQLAGLVVLAGAIAMAVARLSLRARRPQDPK
jgi:hypothetical protein